MIRWLQQEDGEGRFNSRFFRNDENEDELIVYANSDNSDFIKCAEKCVDAFNNLSKPVINEICQKLISCAQEGNGRQGSFLWKTADSGSERSSPMLQPCPSRLRWLQGGRAADPAYPQVYEV